MATYANLDSENIFLQDEVYGFPGNTKSVPSFRHVTPTTMTLNREDQKLESQGNSLNYSYSNNQHSALNYTSHKVEPIIASDSPSCDDDAIDHLKGGNFKYLEGSQEAIAEEKSVSDGNNKRHTLDVQVISKRSESTNCARTTISINKPKVSPYGLKQDENSTPKAKKILSRPNTTLPSSQHSPIRKVTEVKKREVSAKEYSSAKGSNHRDLLISNRLNNASPASQRNNVSLKTNTPKVEPKLREVSLNIKDIEGGIIKKSPSSVRSRLDMSHGSRNSSHTEAQLKKSLAKYATPTENKKMPIKEVYDQILKKHLGGTDAALLKKTTTPLTIDKRPARTRPVTCKNPTPATKEVKNVPVKKENQPTPAQTTTTPKPSSATPANPLRPKSTVPTRAPISRINSRKPTDARETPTLLNSSPKKEEKKETSVKPLKVTPIRKDIPPAPVSTKNPLHSLNNFKYEKMLGQGAYAVVKLAMDKGRGYKIAAKIYEKYMLNDPRRMKNVRREISILQEMDHPNVIKMLDSFETPKQIHVIMEFVGKSSMHSYLRSLGARKLEENEIKRLFIQMCRGLSYCHAKNIVHRDIKLENLLLDDDNNIKIIDFGFSINITPDKKLNIFCGTPSYMAPEIATKTLYKGAPTDVWSLGIILYILLNGHFPFRGTDDRDLFNKIKKGKFEVAPTISEEAKSLLQKILKVNPEERLKIDEIIEDEWLKGY